MKNQLGHKEDSLAKAGSEILASALNTVETMTVGIHWDNIYKEGIQKITLNAEILLDMIQARILSGG